MLTLRYASSSLIPVEAECVTPDNLAGKSLTEIAQLLVQHGNGTAPLGEFFHVEGDAGDGEILIEGDVSRVKLLGSGMTRGKVTIRSDAGMHTGAEMRGGMLEVFGNVGDWVGAEMAGGTLHVHGNAGHLAGAAYRGGRFGMLGGELLIDGDAGNEVGVTMRRGFICVGGAAGDFAGGGMIAGTVVVCGQPGLRMGASMKRGSLVFAGPAPAMLPTFKKACVYEPLWLELYLRKLAALGFAVPLGQQWRRWCGDMVSLGKGEILTRA